MSKKISSSLIAENVCFASFTASSSPSAAYRSVNNCFLPFANTTRWQRQRPHQAIQKRATPSRSSQILSDTCSFEHLRTSSLSTSCRSVFAADAADRGSCSTGDSTTLIISSSKFGNLSPKNCLVCCATYGGVEYELITLFTPITISKDYSISQKAGFVKPSLYIDKTAFLYYNPSIRGIPTIREFVPLNI